MNSNKEKYFTKGQWVLYGTIVILALLFRGSGLEDRPIHHDEAIHLMQGYYCYAWPEERPGEPCYKYDPMTHGPFLYHSLGVVYRLLGSSVFSGRAYMAFLGFIFVLLPFCFRKYLKPKTTLFLTMLIGLSPTMIYWSRFVRSDYLMLSWWCMILLGAVLAPPKWKSFFVILGLSLQVCTKENSYVFFAIMLGYLLFEYCFCKFKDNSYKETCLYKIYKNFLSYKFMYLVSIGLSLFVMYYFFSSGFKYFLDSPSFFEKYFGTLLDGIYRKSFAYWLGLHGEERIKGPFLYQFYMMAWHEFFLVLVFLGHIVYLMKKAIWARYVFILSFLTSIVLALTHSYIGLTDTVIWNFFKLKNTYDFFGLCILPTYSVVVTIYHLLRNEKALAFFGYFASANMATYCYLGEKVPWLSVYPILAFMIYYALLFNEVLKSPFYDKAKEFSVALMMNIIGGISILLGIIFILQSENYKVLGNIDFIVFGIILCILASSFKEAKFNLIKFIFIVFFIYDIRVARIVNFQNAGSEREVFSQVHTSRELHNVLNGIKDTIDSYRLGYEPLMYVKGETEWPTVTYMIGYRQLKYSMAGHKLEDFKYLIEDQESTRKEKKQESIVKGHEDKYNSSLIKTRYWWAPDYDKMTLKAFLNYSFNHVPWSGPGYFHAMFHVRKE